MLRPNARGKPNQIMIRATEPGFYFGLKFEDDDAADDNEDAI